MPKPPAKAENISELKQKLGYPWWGKRTDEIEGLMTTDHPDYIPQLARVLHDGNRHVRMNAVHALVRTNRPEALPHLLEALKGKDSFVRSNTAIKLGLYFKGAAIQFHLLEALEDEDPSVRDSIVQALGERGRRSSIPYLAKIMENDRESFVRSSAAEALRKIGQSMQGQIAKSKTAKALQLVAPHFREKEEPKIVRQAYTAALAGKITPANVRLYIKQLRAVKGNLK